MEADKGEEIIDQAQPTEEQSDELKRKRDGEDEDSNLPKSIDAWIQALDLAPATAAECIQAFHDNEIQIDQVLSLTASDLKDLGITKLGPRKKILDSIEQMKESGPKRAKKDAPTPEPALPIEVPQAEIIEPTTEQHDVQSLSTSTEPVQEGKTAIETPPKKSKRSEGDFPGSEWEQQLAKAHHAQVVLNPLDADPDFRWLFQDDYFHIHTLSINKFVFLWTGGKGNRGVRGGKYWFELQVTEIFDNPDIRDHASWSGLDKHGFRVGWSTADTAPGSLGDDASSFAIDHSGHKWHKEMSSFSQGFAIGDVVGCYIDTITWTISFSKNSAFPAVAFTIPQHLRGQTFFPHVLLKNMRCKLNFGLKSPVTKRATGYEILERAQPGHYVNTALPHIARSDCQLFAIIRFPHAEKSRWQAEFLKQNLDKHYYVLSGDALVSRIKSWLASTARQKGNVPNRLNSVATALLNSMFSLVPKEAPRNYLIDLTGNGPAGRRDKLKHFEGFGKRTAVCIVPTLAQRKMHADFDVAKSTLVLPIADGKEFDAVVFPEGSLEDANKILSEIERKSSVKGKAKKIGSSPREMKQRGGGIGQRGQRGGLRAAAARKTLQQNRVVNTPLLPSPIRRGIVRAAQGKGFSPFSVAAGLSPPAAALRVPRVQLPLHVPVIPAMTPVRTPRRDDVRPLIREEILRPLLPDPSWNKPLLPTPEKYREPHERVHGERVHGERVHGERVHERGERDRKRDHDRDHDRDRAKRERDRDRGHDRDRDRDRDYPRDREKHREEYSRDREFDREPPLLGRMKPLMKEEGFDRESSGFGEHRETQRPSQLLSLYGRSTTPPPPPPPSSIDYGHPPLESSNVDLYRNDHHHHERGRNEFELQSSFSDRPFLDLPSIPSKRFNDLDGLRGERGLRGEPPTSMSARGLSISGLPTITNNSGRNLGGSSLLGGMNGLGGGPRSGGPLVGGSLGGGGFPTPGGIATLQNALLPNLSPLGGLGLGSLPLSRGKVGKIDIRAADVRFAAGAGGAGGPTGLSLTGGKPIRTRFGPPHRF